MNNIFTVKMPDIGEGVVEGEVITWLKKIDDKIEQDEPVVVVMTDKATVELPSPTPGKLVKQYYKEGEMAQRNEPLYDIETADLQTSKPTIAPSHEEKKVEVNHQMNVEALNENKKALATPQIRKLAKDLELNIDLISGTGKEGNVTIEDLKKHLSEVPVAEEVASSSQVLHLHEDQEEPVIGIRKLMAQKMKKAKMEIPHFSYFEKVDATRLMQLKSKIKEEANKEGIHLTFMPFFIKALSLTINRYPFLNSSFDSLSSKLLIHKHQNIGIATSTPLGLIVANLKNIERMSFEEICKSYEELKLKSKESKLNPKDMKESTISISNFGVLGNGQWATPIINYPEVAILALAKIQKEPFIKNDSLVICPILNLSWSFDHRVIDGGLAASISHEFCALVQNPAVLLSQSLPK
jgi:pyruvate dehydrogenase E2 component (dihydrolipoamide acetyltransferase)